MSCVHLDVVHLITTVLEKCVCCVVDVSSKCIAPIDVSSISKNFFKSKITLFPEKILEFSQIQRKNGSKKFNIQKKRSLKTG